MAPVPVRRRADSSRLAAVAALGACLWAGPARAEAEPAEPRLIGETPATASDINVPGGRRSYLQGAMNKVRPDSMLKLDAPPVPPATELRGKLGRRRDQLLTRHYARLAELDALADDAGRSHDLRLAEQIEAARRRDTQQFFLAMQALKVQILSAWKGGGP